MASELPSSEMGFTTSPSPNGRKLAGKRKSISASELFSTSTEMYNLKNGND